MPYFCLPAVPHELARHLGANFAGALPAQDGWVYPMLTVVPMGWNWAFYLAQRVASWRVQVALGCGPE
eukprot:2534865-Lingulodinium_polyedra.AAC.1